MKPPHRKGFDDIKSHSIRVISAGGCNERSNWITGNLGSSVFGYLVGVGDKIISIQIMVKFMSIKISFWHFLLDVNKSNSLLHIRKKQPVTPFVNKKMSTID